MGWNIRQEMGRKTQSTHFLSRENLWSKSWSPFIGREEDLGVHTDVTQWDSFKSWIGTQIGKWL